ncbi:MAG: hypothetical protein GX328_03890 [Clostridiaceae bacterium]|nr:hypothetical protein [Clostridiaceae bacterium]
MSNEILGVQLEIIAQHSEGYFGDPSGFEELLYSTKTANSFLLVGKGGYDSKYSATAVFELTRRQAQDYLIGVKGEEEAYRILPKAAPKKAAKAPAKKAPAKKAPAKKTTTKKTTGSK